MANSLKLILPIAVIALLIGGVVFQEHKLSKKNNETAELSESNTALVAQNNILKKDNMKLTAENVEYINKIDSLEQKVKQLNTIIRRQGGTILSNRKRIAELQEESEALRNTLMALRSDKNADKGVIAKLEDDRFKLDQELGDLFIKNETLKDSVLDVTIEKEDATQQLETATEDSERQKRILDIMQNTKVSFGGTYTKKSNNKRAKSPRTWKHTLINLALEHPDMSLITNEKFMVQIIDIDKEQVLAPRESTAGESDTQGVPFDFTGNPISEIKYSNYQKKTGKNYAVKAFYMKNGKKYPIGSYKRITFKEKE